MSVDAIRAQLERLKIHAVNLDVTAGIARFVELQGSLLQYWKLPQSLDGSWLLVQLQAMSDAAGPEATMNALLAAHSASHPSAGVGADKIQQ